MNDDNQAIQEALKQLDPENNDHWTSDGLPRIDVVANLSGVKQLKRGDISAAAPTFTQDNPTLEAGELPPTEQDPDPETLGQDEIGEGPKVEDEEARDEFGDADFDELTGSLKEADAELQRAQEALDAANRKHRAIQAKRDRILEARERRQGPHENQLGIQQFLASQAKLREQRAERARRVQEQLGEVPQAKSPLDQSMQRKTGHGQGRKEFPNRAGGAQG